ncbi:MAG: hypothetical protein ACRDD8_11735 [Bacteroidales bacterium]
MKLKILERLVMHSLLPEKGTEKENEIMESISKKIFFTDKEIKEKNIVFGDNISFNPEADGDGVDIALTTMERMFLLESFDKASENGSIKRGIYPIYKELKRKLNED